MKKTNDYQMLKLNKHIQSGKQVNEREDVENANCRDEGVSLHGVCTRMQDDVYERGWATRACGFALSRWSHGNDGDLQ